MINRYTFAGLGAVLAVCLAGGLIYLLASPPKSTPKATTPQAQATPQTSKADAKPSATPTAKGAARPKTLADAAQQAGCRLVNAADEGNEHVTRQTTQADYKTNPPTSGIHNPTWAADQIYPPGGTPELGTLVHTLEHGRIDVQYKPGSPADTINTLTDWVKGEDGGYHMLLFENETSMPYAVAATAWTHLIGCPRMNDKVISALTLFREQFIDQGPEVVP